MHTSSRAVFAASLLGMLGAQGQAKAQDVPIVDEGYAFYDVEWSGVSATSGTSEPKSEWYLKASFRVWGTFAERSVLRYVLKQGGKVLGDVRCETRSRHEPHKKNPLDRPHLFTDGCHDRKLTSQTAGEIQIEWHLIDGATDADKLLDTDTVVVRSAPRYDVGSDLRAWYPAMYVDRNAELLSTVLYHRGDMVYPYLGSSGQTPARGDGIDIVVHAAPAWGGDKDPTKQSHVRCKVEGTAIDLRTAYTHGSTHGTTTDEVRASAIRATLGEAETPNPDGNPRILKDSILFRTFYLQLPLTFSGGNSPRHSATPLSRHPGKWECEWRNGEGRTLRTFRFTVADGRVQPHPEQTDKGLSLAPDAVFVETIVPKDDPLDVRTHPSVLATGAFAGRGLKSAAALDLARAVPAVGNPLPPKPQVIPSKKKDSSKKKTK
jgi:hypothetical protein